MMMQHSSCNEPAGVALQSATSGRVAPLMVTTAGRHTDITCGVTADGQSDDQEEHACETRMPQVGGRVCKSHRIIVMCSTTVRVWSAISSGQGRGLGHAMFLSKAFQASRLISSKLGWVGAQVLYGHGCGCQQQWVVCAVKSGVLADNVYYLLVQVHAKASQGWSRALETVSMVSSSSGLTAAALAALSGTSTRS